MSRITRNIDRGRGGIPRGSSSRSWRRFTKGERVRRRRTRYSLSPPSSAATAGSRGRTYSTGSRIRRRGSASGCAVSSRRTALRKNPTERIWVLFYRQHDSKRLAPRPTIVVILFISAWSSSCSLSFSYSPHRQNQCCFFFSVFLFFSYDSFPIIMHLLHHHHVSLPSMFC